MERSVAVPLNVVECVDMALINIHKGIGRKLLDLMLPGTPLVDCSIQLIQISITFKGKSNHSPQLQPTRPWEQGPQQPLPHRHLHVSETDYRDSFMLAVKAIYQEMDTLFKTMNKGIASFKVQLPDH